METPMLERSPSTASTLSCINVIASDDMPEDHGPASTPPTSVTDVASIDSGKDNSATSVPTPTNGRVRRVRSSVASYNENALAGTRRGGKAFRDASGQTLVDGRNNSSQHQLLSNALDIDWDVGEMPGAKLQAAASSTAQLTRRGPLDKAAATLLKTASVLGKRSRSAFESGREKIQRAGKRSSKRLRTLSVAKAAEPELKQTRQAEIQAKKEEEAKKAAAQKPTPMRPRAADKKYLGRGLYVGQDPAFDPRFTVEKNKKRRSTMALEMDKLPTILPPPMFAGKRLLELNRGFRLPYNIFNPLPDRQPKPDEWRKTRKNVFVGDAGDLWKKSKPMEHSACLCTVESGCGDECMNRYMFYECDDTNCTLGAERCTNRAFTDLKQRTKAGGKYRIGVEVIKTKDRGYGVRSNRCFDPGQIIVEYTGEIITQEECDKRMKTRYKSNECFYLMEFDQNMIIDATRGSIARFVNHSCDPNCKMVKWTVAGKPRMALFAGERGIMTGEELSYDYNFDPFSSKNIQECRCGSAACRGVLGPRVSKEKDAKDALAPLTQAGGAKRKLAQAAAGSVAAVKRRKISGGKAASKAASKVASKATGKAAAGRKAATRVRKVVVTKTAGGRGAAKVVAARGKSAATAAKRGAARQLVKARARVAAATGSPAQKARLVKKVSERSLGAAAAGPTVRKVGTVSASAMRQSKLPFAAEVAA